MPITQTVKRNKFTEAGRIINDASTVTISTAADAFDAQAKGEGRVPPLYLCTLGGDRRVTDVERVNKNTYRVFTRTDGLQLGELRIYTMFGGHPLLEEKDVSHY